MAPKMIDVAHQTRRRGSVRRGFLRCRPVRRRIVTSGSAYRGALLLVGLASLGCATGGPTDAAPMTDPLSGVGSLRQNEISLRLMMEDVQVQVTPLSPVVLEATAPDTRRRLSSLVPAAVEGTHFLLSVFTEAPGGRAFEPSDVVLENRGRTFRPARIRGLTPSWGSGQLRQRQPEQAVYTFSPEVDLELPLTIIVAGVRNSAWESIRPRIDAERARIRATERPAG